MYKLGSTVFVLVPFLLALACSSPSATDDDSLFVSGDIPAVQDVACVPVCLGKVCGDDGCGGVCGSCEAGDRCTAYGACVCDPQCDDLECGGDGCGGSCGDCGIGHKCEAGLCVKCLPNCSGLECGDDGCGGTCGECPLGTCDEGTCTIDCDVVCAGLDCGTSGPEDQCNCGACSSGLVCVENICVEDSCVPMCTGLECGDDGCNGSCGECAPEMECVDGICEAIPMPTIVIASPFNNEKFDLVEGGTDVDVTVEITNWDFPAVNRGYRVSVDGEVAFFEVENLTVTVPGLLLGGHVVSVVLAVQTDEGWSPLSNESAKSVVEVQVIGQCDGTDPAVCDDGNPCTVDACIEDEGLCGYNTVPDCCVEDLQCEPGFFCEGNVCVEEPCDPVCEGIECGDDGCGGSCGECDAGYSCQAGICIEDVCVPNCDGFDCGEDGCGGSCGDCDAGYSCQAGVCIEDVCVPNCDGKACGDDGCGGSCGDCDAGYSCQAGVCIEDVCVPDCAGKACGEDGCGGSCGDCVYAGPMDSECVKAECVDFLCEFSPYAIVCDDGDACTLDDKCIDGFCTGGELNVNDPQCICCTDTGCQDDDDLCNAPLVCNPDTCVCEPDPDGALVCGENPDPCLVNQCDPATGECVAIPAAVGAPCDDGDGCTENDACDGEGGCIGAAIDCGDGDICNGVETCVDGACIAGTPKVCTDGKVCTDDVCDPVKGCQFVHNSATCDDGNVCTTGDKCSAGKCAGQLTVVCNDNKVCTDDVCDPIKGCQFFHNTAECDDGDVCTVGDKCSSGTCQGGTPLDCGDGNACTKDSCDPVTGCAHVALVCNDNKICTDDTCDPVKGCQFFHNTAACDDGDMCTDGDKCSGGVCQAGPALNCDDNDACTTDSCDSDLGCVHADTACDDSNPCTTDTCNQGNGCQNKPVQNGTPCPGGDAYACMGGTCVCVPNCDGKMCGDDGCGGSCGNCPGQLVCVDNQCQMPYGCSQILACAVGCGLTEICIAGCYGNASPDSQDLFEALALCVYGECADNQNLFCFLTAMNTACSAENQACLAD